MGDLRYLATTQCRRWGLQVDYFMAVACGRIVALTDGYMIMNKVWQPRAADRCAYRLAAVRRTASRLSHVLKPRDHRWSEHGYGSGLDGSGWSVPVGLDRNRPVPHLPLDPGESQNGPATHPYDALSPINECRQRGTVWQDPVEHVVPDLRIVLDLVWIALARFQIFLGCRVKS